MAGVWSLKHYNIQKVPCSDPDSTSSTDQPFTSTCRNNVIREPCVTAPELVSSFDLCSTCTYSSLGSSFILDDTLSKEPEAVPCTVSNHITVHTVDDICLTEEWDELPELSTANAHAVFENSLFRDFKHESLSCDSYKCLEELFTSIQLGEGESFSDDDLEFALEDIELSSVSNYRSTIATKVKDFKRRDHIYSDSECSKSRKQRVKCNGYKLFRKKYHKKKPKLSGKSFKAVFGFEAGRGSDDSWSRITRKRRMTYNMHFYDLDKNPEKFIKGCLLAKSRTLRQNTGLESDELFGYGDVFGNYRRYSDPVRQYIIHECEKYRKSYLDEKSEGRTRLIETESRSIKQHKRKSNRCSDSSKMSKKSKRQFASTKPEGTDRGNVELTEHVDIERHDSQDASDTEQSKRRQRKFKTNCVNDEAKPVICSDATSTCFQEHTGIMKDELIVVKMGYELPESLDDEHDLETRSTDACKIPLIHPSNIEEINPRLSVFERYLGVTQEFLRFQRHERRKEGLKGVRKAYGPRKRKLRNNSDSYSGESESEYCEEFESFSDA